MHLSGCLVGKGTAGTYLEVCKLRERKGVMCLQRSTLERVVQERCIKPDVHDSQEDFITQNPKWVEELNIMLDTKKKAEIQKKLPNNPKKNAKNPKKNMS